MNYLILGEKVEINQNRARSDIKEEVE